MPFVRILGNVSNSQKGIEFTFYGDHLSIYYTGKTNGGIVNILVDGTNVGTIDSYNATDNSFKQEKAITGLSKSNHTVKIVETGTKNTSSTGTEFWFEALKIPKTIIVKNWGIPGASGGTFDAYKSNLLETNDDIVFLQFGTNDRTLGMGADYTKAYMREAAKLIQSQGKKVVLMVAPQAVNTVENAPYSERRYGQEDVDMAISELADELNMNYISNYNAYQDYMRETGATIDQLLADSLHPNDLGYKVMYQNIMRSLGLPFLSDGMTY